MSWIIRLKAGEVITINGCRVQAPSDHNIKIRLLDQADVVLPNGTVVPRREGEAVVE